MPSYPHSPQAPEGPHILTRRLEDQRKASLPSALKSSHGHMGSGGGGVLCDVTKGPALPGPQSPGASADQCTRSRFVSAHDAVGDDESNVCTPGRQGCSSGPPGRKKIKASPCKDSMCGALTQVKTKLVNLVSRMRNLKLITATGDRRQCPNIEVLGDAQRNITVYELRDTGDPDGVDFHIKEEE
ncbi:hypothetical protein ABFV05_019983 [Capra hircus]